MHRTRWITGLVALPFLIFLIAVGGILFTSFVTLVSLLTIHEYYRIIDPNGSDQRFRRFSVISMATAVALIFAAQRYPAEIALCVIAFNLICCAFLILAEFNKDPAVLDRFTRQIAAVIYIPLPLSLGVFLRMEDGGAAWLFFILGVVFAGDIGALYTGTFWGKHQLCPVISPKKTIEGALGGLGSNLFIGLILGMILLPRLSFGSVALLSLSVGVAGQIGDLFESAFKRAANIKDSGFLLPGHGGLLDRIDALLFALPVAYFFKEFIFSAT